MGKFVAVIALVLGLALVTGNTGNIKQAAPTSYEENYPVVTGFIQAENSIEGVWKLTDFRNDQLLPGTQEKRKEDIVSGKFVDIMTFRNGRFLIEDYTVSDTGEISKDYEFAGKYQIDGNQLIFTFDGSSASSPFEYRLDGNTFELIDPSVGTYIYTRQP